MKNIFLFIALTVFGLAALSSCENKKNAEKPMTIYDTALHELEEFVAQANDTGLGFRNAEEVRRAHIAVDSGISMAILGKGKLMEGMKPESIGDSIEKAMDLDLHWKMNALSRKIYPVFLGTELRAAITFDSTWDHHIPGWKPVMFDNGSILSPYMAALLSGASSAHGKAAFTFVTIPAIQSEVIMMKDSIGEYILPTSQLKHAMHDDISGNGPIERKEFYAALERYLQRKKDAKH